MKRILFFVPEGNVQTNGVYASQIFRLARFLVQQHAAEVMFLQYAPSDEGGDCDVIQLEPSIKLVNDKRKRSYVSIFSQSKFYCTVANRMMHAVNDFKPTHAYCRQYQTVPASRLIADKYGAKVVYSMRGEDVSERRSLKVIVFSDSLFGWQCIDETIELMKYLCAGDGSLRALFLVKDVELLKKKCADAAFSASLWRVRSCQPFEVGKYLQTSDMGVMLRKDVLLNRVASPVKVAEYLSSGLRIIASNCVGALFVRGKDMPFLTDVPPEKIVAQNGDSISEQARDFARTNYTWCGDENLKAVQMMFARKGVKR